MGDIEHSAVDLYIQRKFSGFPLEIKIEYLNTRGGIPLKEYDRMYLKYCSDKFELNQNEKLREKAAKQWYKKLKENSFDYVYISLITITKGKEFNISRRYPKKTRVSAKNVYGFEWHFASRNYIKKYLLGVNRQ